MSEPQAAANDQVVLEIKVSEPKGIKAYGFAYAGRSVPMNRGKGTFTATKNKEELLEWVMLGDAGGTMKVEVLRDKTAIRTRAKSEIVPPYSEGLDAFKILVS